MHCLLYGYDCRILPAVWEGRFLTEEQNLETVKVGRILSLRSCESALRSAANIHRLDHTEEAALPFFLWLCFDNPGSGQRLSKLLLGML